MTISKIVPLDFDSHELGEKIKSLRKYKKLSQDNLISLIREKTNTSISRKTLSHIESGRSEKYIYTKYVGLICTALNIDLHTIFNGENIGKSIKKTELKTPVFFDNHEIYYELLQVVFNTFTEGSSFILLGRSQFKEIKSFNIFIEQDYSEILPNQELINNIIKLYPKFSV